MVENSEYNIGIKLKNKIMHGNSAHEVVPNLDNINLLTIFYRVCNKSMLKVFKLQMLKCVGTKKSRLRVTS